MVTKTTDSKGRVSLGNRFANKTVIIRESDPTEVVISLARIIPEREAWLYENAEAKAAVYQGLAQARAGQFAATPPDLEADEAIAVQMGGAA
jgi:hypothetical protein